MQKKFMVKQKIVNRLDAKALEISAMLATSDDLDEIMDLTDKLDRIERLRAELKKPKISKEAWVEILKIIGVAAALGAVMVFETKGHILPKNLDKWIPGPKL